MHVCVHNALSARVLYTCNTHMTRISASYRHCTCIQVYIQIHICAYIYFFITGTDALIKILKNYSRSENLKKSITVGIIGYPNVGKSSLINSLKRAKTCTYVYTFTMCIYIYI